MSSDPSGQSLHAIWSTAAPVWGRHAEYIDARGASVHAMLHAADLVAAGGRYASLWDAFDHATAPATAAPTTVPAA